MEGDLTVRQAEALARHSHEETGSAVAPARTPRAPRGKDADTAALEQDLSEALGLFVEIKDRNGAGEVRVRYASLEQLDTLCQRLSGG